MNILKIFRSLTDSEIRKKLEIELIELKCKRDENLCNMIHLLTALCERVSKSEILEDKTKKNKYYFFYGVMYRISQKEIRSIIALNLAFERFKKLDDQLSEIEK